MLKQKMQTNLRQFSLILMVIISFLIGFILGYGLRRETNINYISQSELLELEKARLNKEGVNNRQLFFGKPEEAIKLIEEIQSQKTKGNNIVLLSQNTIYGKKVKSISEEVHRQIIEQLK